ISFITSPHTSFTSHLLHLTPPSPRLSSALPTTLQAKLISQKRKTARMAPITTPLTTLLSIRHPILLAGMARTSGSPLAAAVSNAGGLGVIGGFMYTPSQLRSIIAELKSLLTCPNLPFGIDLALPQVGGGARKTNHDYTGGKLDELIDITI